MSVWFGDKTIAWFDVWSIEHIVAGITTYSICELLLRKSTKSVSYPSYTPYILLLLSAFMWESLEHYLEAGVTGIEAVTFWFQGVEFWGNRLITDPLMMLLGGWIARQNACIIWPARLFSVLWLIVHIFIFPHSMYLHTLFAVI